MSSSWSIIGLAIGLAPRWLARQKLRAETRADAMPIVATVSPAAAQMDLGTPLPADVQPFIEAAIHARASGYLKSWLVDIGDHVTNNQMLAEIDTPELDQQFAQARAELDQTIAARDLAKITADRWTELLKTASVSEQETEEKNSDYCAQTSQRGSRPRQCAAAGRHEEFRPRHRALRRGGHAAQHRHWPARLPPAAVRNCSAWRKPIRCASMCACPNQLAHGLCRGKRPP